MNINSAGTSSAIRKLFDRTWLERSKSWPRISRPSYLQESLKRYLLL